MDISTNIKAIIFDLDGVLVQTNELHIRALSAAVMTCICVDLCLFPKLTEVSMISTAEKINQLQKLYYFDDEIFQTIMDLKDNLYHQSISDMTIDPNVYETLDYIKSKNIKMAIASNSRLKNINRILDNTALREYFDTIVSAEEVKHRKPAPDILLEVYRRLNIDGTDTLFVEDTDEGAEAGHNSPSIVVRVNSPKDLTIEFFRKWVA